MNNYFEMPFSIQKKKDNSVFHCCPIYCSFFREKNPALKLCLATTIETFRVIAKFGEIYQVFFFSFKNYKISGYFKFSWKLLSLIDTLLLVLLVFNKIFSQLIYLCYWGFEPTALCFTIALRSQSDALEAAAPQAFHTVAGDVTGDVWNPSLCLIDQ